MTGSWTPWCSSRRRLHSQRQCNRFERSDRSEDTRALARSRAQPRFQGCTRRIAEHLQRSQHTRSGPAKGCSCRTGSGSPGWARAAWGCSSPGRRSSCLRTGRLLVARKSVLMSTTPPAASLASQSRQVPRPRNRSPRRPKRRRTGPSCEASECPPLSSASPVHWPPTTTISMVILCDRTSRPPVCRAGSTLAGCPPADRLRAHRHARSRARHPGHGLSRVWHRRPGRAGPSSACQRSERRVSTASRPSSEGQRSERRVLTTSRPSSEGQRSERRVLTAGRPSSACQRSERRVLTAGGP